MKKLQILMLLVSILFLLSTNVSATLVKYDVTNTEDRYGNDVWGSVFFEEEPGLGYYESGNVQGYSGISNIRFNIDEFLFASVAGSFSGDRGFLDFMVCPPEVSGQAFVETWGASMFFYGFVGWWENVINSVDFYNNDVAYDRYDIESFFELPEKMVILDYYFSYPYNTGWGLNAEDAHKAYPYLTLTRSTQPVPEPATMLLLGSGLLGLAGFRRKFRKR